MKKWQLKPKAPSAFLKKFPEYSNLITQLLYNRDIKTQEQIDEFFNPDFQKDIHNPFLIKGIKKAVKRILKAVKKQEKIVIYGDFDADGVCSTAILFITLEYLGAKNIRPYIPDRDKEGHGLNKKAIRELANDKTNLIITVDCGSSNVKEIELANSLGVDIIITDHHQIGYKPPKAFVIVNPYQEKKEKKDRYCFRNLSGAGVTYKLACALLSSKKNNNQDESLKKWLLDLTAISTVTDVMPIIGENRTIVKYGLGVLAQTKWIGLKELMDISKITPNVTQVSISGEAPRTNLNTDTLAYILGPRLNAAGRIDHADNAFYLLISKSMAKAKQLAQKLNNNNVLRQSSTDKIVKEIIRRFESKSSKDKEQKMIIEGSPDWPIGLIGLVAGKIADKYSRPTCIFNERKGIIRGSLRSIPNFDLMEALKKCADCFDDFGGHKGAAGFQMKKENLNQVRESLKKTAEKIKNNDLISVLDIDAKLSLDEINWHNYDQIQLFAPFGKANLEPKFLIKGAEIKDLRTVGNGSKHLKMEVIVFGKSAGTAKKINAIGFGLGEWECKIKRGDLVDIVFQFIVNEWNGSRDLEMKVVDLKCV
ncbi:MAG: single-stranded-DNA-specific exonuclease RecJ [bacterium]